MVFTFKSVARDLEDFGGEIVAADLSGPSERPAPAYDADGWLTLEGYSALAMSKGESK